MREFQLLIDGEDVEGDGWTYVLRASAMIRDTVGTFNLKRALELGRHEGPVPDIVEARCAKGNREHSRQAVAAARRASREFTRLPLYIRMEIVRQCHQGFIDHKDELIELMVIEGHPRRLAEWELSGMIRGTDKNALDWHRAQFDSEFTVDGERIQLVRKPDGVVCVNPPQNAPGSNGAMGIMALLAGNTLVVKAPHSCPMSVMYIYRNIVQPALNANGAPAGTLNIISGHAQQMVRDWIASPDVDDILFFGGSDVGLKIGADCVAAGKKPVLELSGNDGLVVWEDADLSAAAKSLSECFYGSAQICMVPKFALVHPRVADKFIAELLDIVRDIRPGYPETDDTLLSPVLKADQFYDYLGEAREFGAEMLCGGSRVDVSGEPKEDGLFFEPTVIRVSGLSNARKLSCVTEETFFPLLPIVVATPTEEADLVESMIEFLNENRYGLRNSLWTRSDRVGRSFAEGLTNGGQLKINSSHIGFHSYLSTHGGTGRTGGPFGELNYVALRTSHLQGIAWGTGEVQPIDQLVHAPCRSPERGRVPASGLRGFPHVSGVAS